ncbi:MAG TPA: DUF2798 domain-containing protein, partial [Cellvibrio sp.]|nr:DUF2798 domain-containing protein [Cellvibrio sp.]
IGLLITKFCLIQQKPLLIYRRARRRHKVHLSIHPRFLNFTETVAMSQSQTTQSQLPQTDTRKLHPKFTPIVFAFYMSLIMAFLMSMIIVAANSGIADHYLAQVIHAYSIAMPSAFFCILLVRPLVMKLVKLTVKMS